MHCRRHHPDQHDHVDYLGADIAGIAGEEGGIITGPRRMPDTVAVGRQVLKVMEVRYESVRADASVAR